MPVDPFSLDLITLWTVLAMGAATFAVRAGGYFLIQRVRTGPFLAAWMRHVPGAIFISLVAPAVISGGPPAWVGGAVTALLAARRAPFFLTLTGGVAAVALTRLLS